MMQIHVVVKFYSVSVLFYDYYHLSYIIIGNIKYYKFVILIIIKNKQNVIKMVYNIIIYMYNLSNKLLFLIIFLCVILTLCVL